MLVRNYYSFEKSSVQKVFKKISNRFEKAVKKVIASSGIVPKHSKCIKGTIIKKYTRFIHREDREQSTTIGIRVLCLLGQIQK